MLQFGGASGSGYLLPREVKAGMEELKTFGEFKDGIFHRHEGVPGKRNMDAYQAIWEHAHGREMVYPKGRYDAPIMMESASYKWAPVKGANGVSEKLFGVWTERRTEAGLVRLEAGASYDVNGRGIYLVLSGAGECEGKALKQYSAVYLDHDEHATLASTRDHGIPALRLARSFGYGGGRAHVRRLDAGRRIEPRDHRDEKGYRAGDCCPASAPARCRLRPR